jgi:hypothetical protein
MATDRPTYHLAADHPLQRVRQRALAVGLVAGAACALGALLAPEQFLRSYLVAWIFWVGVALGCLAILMINYITGGAWGAVIRRPLESGTRTLPLMAVLFLPIALGVRVLYEWAQPEAVAHDPILQHKSLYLNVPFFLLRTVVYFGAWITVSRFLNRWSQEQDAADDPGRAHSLEQLSRGGLLLLGLTMTFAAVDWMMSLEPHWYSTIYGVIFMGGSVLAAFAVVIPVTAAIAARPPFTEIIRAGQFHDLGKLLLAFLMLWAYFSFSQFLITWSGNLPEEIPWYLRRLGGGWQWIALGLVAFHFVLPFAVLLSRDVKQKARALATIASALVVLRFADLFWTIAPAFHPERLAIHVLDVAAALAVGGVWLAVFVRSLEGRPLLPLNDPSLPALP